MADLEVQALDTPPEGATQGDATGGTVSAAAPKLFFGKYKNEEEAEHGYKEAEHKISQLGEEVAKLRQQAELKTVLETLAKIPAARPAEEPKAQPVDWETFSAGVADDLQTEPIKGVRKLVQLMGSWTADTGREVKTLAESKLNAIEAKINSLADAVERRDVFYEKHQARIDRLIAGGMSLTSAKKFVREEIAETDQNQAGGVERILPTPVGAGRVTQRPVPKETYLSPEDRAAYKVQGLTDEVLDTLETEYHARRAAKGGGK